MGDRFAHQGKAKLQAVLQAQATGLDIYPTWNKSFQFSEPKQRPRLFPIKLTPDIEYERLTCRNVTIESRKVSDFTFPEIETNEFIDIIRFE